MEKVEYPKWIYSKKGESKIVHDADEHKEAGAGWGETPTESALKVTEAPDGKIKKHIGSNDGSSVDTVESSDEEVTVEEEDLHDLEINDLIAKALDAGHSKKDVKGSSKAQLIKMLKV